MTPTVLRVSLIPQGCYVDQWFNAYHVNWLAGNTLTLTATLHTINKFVYTNYGKSFWVLIALKSKRNFNLVSLLPLLPLMEIRPFCVLIRRKMEYLL